jgi:integrase
MLRQITQAGIARLRAGQFIADTAEKGLRVERFTTRTSYVYRYRDKATGRLRQVTLGEARVMAIADARAAVRELRRIRSTGADPAQTMRDVRAEAVHTNIEESQQAAYTVKQLIDAYSKEHLAATKRGAERERTLRRDLKHWYQREAAALKRKDVKALLEAVAARAPNIAGRVLRDLRAAYLHALDRERLPEGADPTHGVKAPKASRYVPRDRAFNEGEWRTFYSWLPSSGMSGDVQDALRLVALTACRPGEVTAVCWRDIDLENRTWVIRERKHTHTVYLNAPAVAILSRRKCDDISTNLFVFPSPTRRGKPMREHALVWALANARDGCKLEHWTAHDLRRSAGTLLGNLGYSVDLIGRVLGHYSIRRPTHIYDRSTRDTQAREAWAALGEKLSELARPQQVRKTA